jgi:hypothetical protein
MIVQPLTLFGIPIIDGTHQLYVAWYKDKHAQGYSHIEVIINLMKQL